VEAATQRAMTLGKPISYKTFKHILESLVRDRSVASEELELSLETQSFVRSMDYFTHHRGEPDNV